LCKVCHERTVSYQFDSCEHAMCAKCVEGMKFCPFDGKKIKIDNQSK
jgi:hypothetical protein